MRGTRPWDQFLNYCHTVARTEGSRTQAAMLSDGRFDEMFTEKLQQMGDTPARPELEGDTREVQGLRQVAVEIAQLHRTIARSNSIPVPQGPVYPAERIQTQTEDEDLNDLLTDIYAAMKR